jgi:hypothetical protein
VARAPVPLARAAVPAVVASVDLARAADPRPAVVLVAEVRVAPAVDLVEVLVARPRVVVAQVQAVVNDLLSVEQSVVAGTPRSSSRRR